MKRIIVGISGASGVIIGYRLLQALKELAAVETHLVITSGARRNFALETDLSLAEICAQADVVHDEHNMAAAISSGSFITDGMIVAPCSMKTLAGIANGYAENLLLRAADVCLKEGRKVVLVPREMPLGKIHLRNLALAADAGCTIIPPMLTFYNAPSDLNDQIDHIIGKILRQFGWDLQSFVAWRGVE